MTDILNDPITIGVVAEKPAAQEDATRIAVIVDESGSMMGAAKATIDSLNSYLDEQATNDKPTLVSVYTFKSNGGVKRRFASIDAKSAPRLFRNNDLFETPGLNQDFLYAPAGGTPLHDAVAEVITKETGETPTLVVILTDGQENASREYKQLANIQALIKQQEEAGWTFVWLMAGLGREESVAMTSKLMGRNSETSTMTYQKGMEDVAFHGLVGATKGWETATRSHMMAGSKIIGSNTSKDFFAPENRNLKK